MFIYNPYVRVNLLFANPGLLATEVIFSWVTESGKAGPLALNFHLVLFEVVVADEGGE